MSSSDFEITNTFQEPVLRRLVRVKGVEFDEDFLAEIIADYFNRKQAGADPLLSDAMAIYLYESDASDNRKFRGDVLHVFNRFSSLLGNLPLRDLRYVHACAFRDYLLGLGLAYSRTY